VVTPPRRREEDLRILGASATTVTLSATPDTLTPGEYTLWFDRDQGHARIGEILRHTDRTVTRVVLGVDFGDLSRARAGRISGWYYLSPQPLGVSWEDIEYQTEFGGAPAWLVPAAEPTDRWVIQVHGRAVNRREGLRAVPVFREAGYTSMLISYRNDGEAPRSPDHRYALGDTEWRDVEAALAYAIDHGARHVILMGWSMGGATVLQALTRSPLARAVDGVVLDSPVVDWVTALSYQAALNHLPPVVRHAVMTLLTRRWAGRLTGQAAPIDLARLNLVSRATELRVPILLLHSDDDGFVPVDASAALAAARPDIITFERFTVARHTKLWNYDRARWNSAIGAWLSRFASTSA
jgi:alpha-beta hydrolase superfamily lysophospholipase